jgi:tight adherence protein C
VSAVLSGVDPALAEALRPAVLLWPLLFGLGCHLLLTAQPIGRPKPDLAERLRRLDVDERVRMEVGRRAVRRPVFASRLLEGMLRPVIDDLGALLRTLLSRVGLAGGAELERSLRVARPGVEPAAFFGEKAAIGAMGLSLLPALNAVGAHPFGPWPVWAWAALGAAGFLAPDWDLGRRQAAHRAACLVELPTLLDMLAIATSAGLALEQALVQVGRGSRGVVAGELRRVARELALGQRTLTGALEAMAERNAVPELVRVASHLRAAHEQGLPLAQTLAAEAEALRDGRRLALVEEGGKAQVRMILPVALLILPPLFVILLVPAAVQVLGMGG